PDAGLLPQRHGLRRQQRPDRFQGNSGLPDPGAGHPDRALCRLHCGAWRLLPALPLRNALQARPRPAGAARCREPGAVPRLHTDLGQAVCLRARGRARMHCRCPLGAAGRHHQSVGSLAGQLHRDRDLGRGGWPRHALWRHSGRRTGQPDQDLADRSGAGSLAFRAGWPVHRQHAALPQGCGRPARAVEKLAGRAAELQNRGGRMMRPVIPVPSPLIQPATAGMAPDIIERPRVSDTQLYLDGVSVSFDGFKAINNLALMVAPGELRTIIGPNGAGKTTMMDIITGKTRPDSGEVLFAGRVDLTKLDETAIANLGIGRKFQKPTVFENLTVFENFELALKAPRGAWKTLGARLDSEALDRMA